MYWEKGAAVLCEGEASAAVKIQKGRSRGKRPGGGAMGEGLVQVRSHQTALCLLMLCCHGIISQM